MADIRLFKSIVKGLLTYFPGVIACIERKNDQSTHSCSQAEFCYALWLSILRHFEENEIHPKLDSVGEIGTGGSLGVGICALLSGSRKFFALEIAQSFDKNLNLKLLNDLVFLFRNRTRIPNNFQNLTLQIKNSAFPDDLIKPSYLEDELINEIRNDIENGHKSQKRIFIIKNWENHSSLNLDFIYSRAVMEHVANPEMVYRKAAKHLIMGSYMFHDIEFHSHGVTQKINGHYQIPASLWQIIVGKRTYFLNRLKLQDHLKYISQNNFEIINTTRNYFKEPFTNSRILSGATVLSEIRD